MIRTKYLFCKHLHIFRVVLKPETFDSVVVINLVFICFTQVDEWQSRAEKFEEMCCSVIQMFTRLSNSANRTILYDLYPYLWDIKSIISMVKSFVQWLGRYGDNSLLLLKAF